MDKVGPAPEVTCRMRLAELVWLKASLTEMVTKSVPVALATRLTVATSAVPLKAKVTLETRLLLVLDPLNVRLVMAVSGEVTGSGMLRVLLAEVVSWSAISPSTGGAGAVTVSVKLCEALVMPSLAITVISDWPVTFLTGNTVAVTLAPFTAKVTLLTRSEERR